MSTRTYKAEREKLPLEHRIADKRAERAAVKRLEAEERQREYDKLTDAEKKQKSRRLIEKLRDRMPGTT